MLENLKKMYVRLRKEHSVMDYVSINQGISQPVM